VTAFASVAYAIIRTMALSEGPAFDFWLRVQRALYQLEMSTRELAEASGVSTSTIARLRVAPARTAHRRREIVRRIAKALNEVAAKRDQGVPFPDDREVLRLAGLVDLDEAEAPISVRTAIRQSTEYTTQEKTALLSLLDVLDAQRPDRVPNEAV
jgi:transcriptional regulator with XRE-family HTH domain